MAIQGFCQSPVSKFIKGLHEGDLMFCISNKGNAITDVTHGINNLNISHVAIFHKNRTGIYALEATHKGVCMNPIDSFIHKGETVVIGRVASADISGSIKNALKQLNKPYDFYFETGDSAIYCSELVQISYIDKSGQLVFPAIPMSFHDASNNITDFWKAYYAKAGKTVPEGAPGSNPGEMSRRKEVKIIKVWYFE